jgi:hypothetical protein
MSGDLACHRPKLRRATCLPHLGLPRSSFYHASRRGAAAQPAARRGPVPPVAEDSLLAASTLAISVRLGKA